ncbi:transcriptional regulator, LysR family [Gluconacetobacter diazotrophicus PA1 5]|uniref:LysR family transcriptional regulator n=2 Tax=Gluconacetobacter diazotrophicus TaxID=33996 RepID=A0A7W4FEN9_GLUDI|nr:LysR family transcriptional regulator [Gluconacetobacter diazotrophicus]ACI52630.1 transcriptional regulator, LysR family [Gluconacetobacter diazotrophicus PA1 5]MBB2156383.1 LysR family transcriptional regulator [Gluconacetobacter diazotrophicus]TWB06037.1 LysR family transcriptional regulator [Gluconacetobacter diazotrophicus]CAP57423.1 putative transcriptional regulator LysR [Gluconacetobacter diazotrophicus PA1 5]
MDNRTGEMQVFVRVVECGSFSEAARQLFMTPSTVSKLIARLESRLGVRLIERSTRRLSLSAEGQLYYERGQALLAELDDMEQTVSQGMRHTSGIVRVSASVAFGTLGLEPLLPAFWSACPNVIVDLSLSDEIIDLFLDRTDIAFRVGKLADSTLTTQRIGSARRKIVASPAYLARHGTPDTVDDLARHNCLGFNFRRAAPVWPLREGGRIVDRMVHGTLLANNGETVRRLAVAGMGLARLGNYHVREDIAAGRLVEVLAQAGIHDEEDIHAIYSGTQRMPQRMRVFLDFVIPKLRAFLNPA